MSKLAQPEGRKQVIRKVLIMSGIVILTCIALRSALSLGLWIASSMGAGTQPRENFWSNEFPMMILVAIIGIGSFGIYKLVRILRK